MRDFVASIKVPGFLWVALIMGIIPILNMYFPEYKWTALVVALLGLAAKLLQMYLIYKKSGQEPDVITRGPAALSSPRPRESHKIREFLVG